MKAKCISKTLTTVILVLLTFWQFQLFAQSTLFSIVNQPATLDDGQSKVINFASAAPHIGNLKFVQFASLSTIGQNGNIDIALPNVNNGNTMTFELQNAVFDDAQHFSILGSGASGYLNLYISPEGIGGTIDLVTRLFVLIPLGLDNGILTERNFNEPISSICANEVEVASHGILAACEPDCGAATLDVLLLKTSEANNWLQTTWGSLSAWFLFMESHNINLAFTNSDIQNKRVRVTPVNFMPSQPFQWSSNSFVDNRIAEDLNAVSSNSAILNLVSLYRADIAVVLTNNNYTGPLFSGGTGTIFGAANSQDPLSTNKFCITQVANIDPTRYTLAHELGHQFGCRHSSEANGTTCPFGKNMVNGRNTIMANGAANNTRIPNYSNPDIFFSNESTGNLNTRNNAQQIRGAFCESANNNPDPQFSVYFIRSTPGPICFGDVHTFSSTIIPGDCIDPFELFPSPKCGVSPFQYEWRKGNSPNFTNTNSQIIGTSANVSITIQSCQLFYLKLTVTSSNGLTATSIKSFKCATGLVCDRNSRKLSDETKFSSSKCQAIPNPTTDDVSIFGAELDLVTNVECFNLQGTKIPISFFKEAEFGAIKIPRVHLPSGLYFFRISRNNLNETVKVVIQ